jgi:hypothetical protein
LRIQPTDALIACLKIPRYRLRTWQPKTTKGRGVPNLSDAYKMLNIFASCGAQSFVVTKTDLEWKDHKNLIWGKTYAIEDLREKLPAIVRTSALRHPVKLPDDSEVMSGENVIIRPTGPGVAFMQLDDLKTQEQIDRVRPAAFIIHETSPGNR